jgi:hypothetical protein
MSVFVSLGWAQDWPGDFSLGILRQYHIKVAEFQDEKRSSVTLLQIMFMFHYQEDTLQPKIQTAEHAWHSHKANASRVFRVLALAILLLLRSSPIMISCSPLYMIIYAF